MQLLKDYFATSYDMFIQFLMQYLCDIYAIFPEMCKFKAWTGCFGAVKARFLTTRDFITHLH